MFGYSTFNDLTARRAQKLTSQWTLGKNGDFTGPLGPLVSRDEVGDLRDGLQVRTRVNGTEVQNGNTRDMIFSVPAIIALISQTFTLHPGDVIATGTPEGVGYARTPQWLLQPGDTVEVEIDRLGTLVTPSVNHPSGRGPDDRRQLRRAGRTAGRDAGPHCRGRAQRTVPGPGPGQPGHPQPGH